MEKDKPNSAANKRSVADPLKKKPKSAASDAAVTSVEPLIPCRPSIREIFEKSDKARSGHKGFRFPNADLIQSRSSTITKSFARSLTPRINASVAELEKLAVILKMDEFVCAYCGEARNTWDHFRPLVSGSSPEGYIDEVDNLLPACSTCNSQKGNSEWQTFMEHEKISPLARLKEASRIKYSKIPDSEGDFLAELRVIAKAHDARIDALGRFNAVADPIHIDLKTLFTKEKVLEDYERWLGLEIEILESLKKAVPLLNILRPLVWKKAAELEAGRDSRKNTTAGYLHPDPPEETLRNPLSPTSRKSSDKAPKKKPKHPN